MRLTMVFLLSTCFLAAAIPAWGQAAKQFPTKPGILGYLDPRTGAFRPVFPLPATDDNEELPAATTVTGTVTLTITITNKSADLQILCDVDVATMDGPSTSQTFYEETAEVQATGSPTKTCKFTVPYSWSLNTPSTDTMTTSYIVTGASGSGGLLARGSSRLPLDTRKVPANGAITALTASVTQ